MELPLKPAVGMRSVVIAAVVIALVGVACGDSDEQACADFRFDQAAWLAEGADEGEDSPRRGQAEQLDRCGTLIDMSRREVRALLGPAPGGTPRDLWIYPVGATARDTLQLSVTFEGGRVSAATAGQG